MTATIDRFIARVEETYGTKINYLVVADPKNGERPLQVNALVITGSGDHTLPEMIIEDCGGLEEWPIAVTGSKVVRSKDDPLWIYKTPVFESAVMFLFSEREA